MLSLLVDVPLSVSCVSLLPCLPLGLCLQCALGFIPLLAVCYYLHLSDSATLCHCWPSLVPVSVTWVSSISAFPFLSLSSDLPSHSTRSTAGHRGGEGNCPPASGLPNVVSTWWGKRGILRQKGGINEHSAFPELPLASPSWSLRQSRGVSIEGATPWRLQ